MRQFRVAISSIICLVVFALHTQAEKHHGNEITDSMPMPRVMAEEMPESVIQFTLHALKNLVVEKPTENFFYSPMSVYSTLLMHLQTLSGETHEKLKKILHITAVHSSTYESAFVEMLKRVDHSMMYKGLSHTEDPSTTEVTIANAFFVQKDHTVFNTVYKSMRNKYFPNATYMSVDFVGGHTTEATSTVNSFIAEHTKNHIMKFYEHDVYPGTPAVLVNTLMLHGVWEKPFDMEHTEVGKFHTTGSGMVDVHFMHGEGVIPHSFSDNFMFDTIELKFKGGEISMFVVLPRPSQTIKNMTEHAGHFYDMHEISHNSKPVKVDYKIPKMKFSLPLPFVKAVELGSVMESTGVHHVVEMDVHEHGTMAAAATAVGDKHPHMWPETHDVHEHPFSESMTPAKVQFYADRSFIVAIVHKPTTMILYQGVVHKPYY